ncbi:unnamed protein product [Owenia fusiformis]|uniref:Uncharacterized protein n=1 Tax=Owenia fusiformis TaxID=6347 RepID=A0A8J1UVS9_OWEFU|nr:unnamed protein product [Owenia fusiformis]
MAADQAQFQSLLQGLLSPDNDIRNQHQSTYDALPIPQKIIFLVPAIRDTNSGAEVQSIAAVLLRRIITTSFDESWPALDVGIQNGLKDQVLHTVREEQNPVVKRKVCDIVAELARNLLDDDGNNSWPEVLKFMFDCAQSEDSALKESALRIFSTTPGIFGNQQAQYLHVIKDMLHHCLMDASHQVRFEAVKATAAFILANDEDEELNIQNLFKDLLQLIVQGVTDSVALQQDDTVLKCLIDLAENTPKFLRGQLENIITLSMKVLSDANIPDSWRHLSLEVIVTLSETAPAMLRKHGKFIEHLVPQILALMVDLEEDDDWATADNNDEDDNDSNPIAGESALDRLACGLGGKTMLPHIIANISQMLANALDWRYRHAALMAISACGEGCHKNMELMLHNIVEAVLPFLGDKHPRVRYAACNALGQLSTDFGPIFQKKFHEKVVTGLLIVMGDYPNPRVQAHAGAALVNFSEDCPKNIITPYLDVIIAKLEQVLSAKFKELLEVGNKMVLEQVVTTLASVADTAEEKFIAYYDRFMPSLKYIMQNANDPKLKLLRGKTIECISLIGLAVGKDKFIADAGEVMQLLLKSQVNVEELDDDDPQISYMISAWARMCKIMGKEFEQYLPLVMGPVLKAASIKPEVAVLDSDDMKVMENDSDWQFVTLGDQQSFGIRTAGLEEKATACQMLVCYARELKEGFAAYAEQCVHIMIPLLKFYFHDGVRVAAAESMPFLLDCAKIRGPEYITQMWSAVCPELLKAIEHEPENDIKSELMHSFAQCVERMGNGCLSAEVMAELLRILDKTLKDHFMKQQSRQDVRKDEDYDEVVEETLLDENDEDVYILSKVSDIIHSLFGTHKEAMLPYFEHLLPHFVKLLNSDRPWPDKQWGLCIFDDLMEHAGPHSIKYQEFFLKQMLEYICDKQAEVRQAACYGVGVMAQNGGPQYAQACHEAIPSLVKVIQEQDSRNPENVCPTENAISAITKICKYQLEEKDVEKILPDWLSWLPVYEDEDEAVHVYTYLCDLMEKNNPIVVGWINSNVPTLIKIIAEVFAKGALGADDEVGKRLVKLVRQIQQNEEVFQVCINSLTEEQKVALSEVMTACPPM